MTNRSTIVITAGGSGGHLFPAQALAGELIRRGKKIVVMTDARGTTYTEAFPDTVIETVPSAAFSDRSFFRLLTAPFEILAGIVVALAKLRRIRPGAVVGFGGYPTVPIMIAASLARLPTAILEQNAVVGRANRLVMNRMRIIAAAFPIARFAPRDISKIVLVGNPVRPDVVALAGSQYEKPTATGPLRLLVFGGSQGARALSDIVPAAIADLPSPFRARLEIVQQCRAEDIERVRAAYGKLGVTADLQAFFKDLPARIAHAHLVISRAGAGTVSELAVIGRPAILVPLPFALDDNQTPNADILEHAGAGWRVRQAELTPQKLAGMLSEAFSAPDDLARRATAARKVARPDAAQRLADVVEELAKAA